MALTSREYLGLSALAYLDFSNVVYNGQDNKISSLVNTSSKPEYASLVSLADYTLINFQSNPTSGFAAAAFQAPDDANGNCELTCNRQPAIVYA